MATDRPLFRPTYRLLGYCLLIGVFGGLAAIGFDWLVDRAQGLLLEGVGRYRPPQAGVAVPAVEPLAALAERWWLPVVTTLGGLISGILVFTLAPEAEGHGTDAAIGAYHSKGGTVRFRIPFVKALASAATLGSGGVAGREGPAAQISVGVGAILARGLGLRGQERRVLLLAAMAAGLAAIFRAPLGMAIFAVEILYAELVFESEALIYTVVSAVTAYAVQGVFTGWDPLFAIPGGMSFHEPLTLLAFAVLGILAGAIGALEAPFFYWVRDRFAGLPGPRQLHPALGGLLIGLAGMLLPAGLGTGYGWLQLAIAGQLSLGLALPILAFKIPGLALTIGSGGSGGVFGPNVVIGGMLGMAVGTAAHALLPGSQVPIAAYVVVGMAAVFAGAARTPISTLIMVPEMTGGYGLIVPTMLANVLSFLTQRSATAGRRHPTLYESQVPRREDSPTHQGVFVRRAVRMLEEGGIDAADLTLPRLASLLRFGEPIPVADDRWWLVSITVQPGSTFAGRTVAETLGGVAGTTAVAVMRQGEMRVARGPTRLEPGDQLLAIATRESRELLQAFAAGEEPEDH